MRSDARPGWTVRACLDARRVTLLAFVALALSALGAVAATDAEALLARSDDSGLTIRGETGDDEFVRVQVVQAGFEWDVHNLNSNLYSPGFDCRTIGAPGILVPPVFSSMRCKRRARPRVDVDLNRGDDVFQALGPPGLGGGFPDSITVDGDDGNDDITGTRRRDVLRGGNGNDIVRGFIGGDELRGGGGQDTIQGGDGPDEINGGARRDVLEGGAGDDELTGGTARDTLRGGTDDDVIRARDDTIDTIDCGTGEDRAILDRDDIVGRCETVEIG